MKHNTAILVATTTTLLLGITTSIAEDRTFEFDAIHTIEASAGIKVTIIQGDMQTILVSALAPSDFDHLELTFQDGTLHASQEYSFFDIILSGGLLNQFFDDDPRLEVKITIPAIQAVQASSGAQLAIWNMPGENLRANVSSGAGIEINMAEYNTYTFTASSGANITADGSCASIAANVSSGASIQVPDLLCVSADANASSGGNARIFASETLKANASSGGSINVEGEPQKIDTSSSSGGNIYIAN